MQLLKNYSIGQINKVLLKKNNFKINWVLLEELAIGPQPLCKEHLIFLRDSGIKSILSVCYENEIKILKEKKEQAQPTKIRTSGSTFKNPIDQSDKKVWQLIKESVPLEKSFGDASISQKHCNFFVNKGNAKFEDMKKLINFVSDSVFKKTGIKLETEIKILE